MPNGPKVSAGGALSPRGDWRAPCDASAAVWLDELRRERAGGMIRSRMMALVAAPGSDRRAGLSDACVAPVLGEARERVGRWGTVRAGRWYRCAGALADALARPPWEGSRAPISPTVEIG